MTETNGNGLAGEYKIIDRGNGALVAEVKIEYRAADDGTYVFVRWPGEKGWTEDPDAFGLMLGENGSVVRK